MDRYQPMTRNAVADLVVFAAAADGRPDKPGKADVDLWLGVAHTNRWRADEARRAVVELAGEVTGEYARRILPGAVNARVKYHRGQPPPFEAAPVVDPATAAARAAAVREFVERTAARKAIGSAHPEAAEATS